MSESTTCLLPPPNAIEPVLSTEPHRLPRGHSERPGAKPLTDRVVGADGLRAFACLWVVGHHVAQELALPSDGLTGFFRTHGPQGVAVFFVLSGLLLSLPFWQAFAAGAGLPDLKKFAVKRLARIVPGYYVCLAVMFACYHDFSAADLVRLLSAITFTNSFHWQTYFPVKVNGACWSIGVEMVFYVLLPFWAAGLFRLRSLAAGRRFCVATMVGLIFFQLALTRLWTPIAPPLTEDPGDFLILAADWLPQRNPVGLFAHFLFGCLAASFFVRVAPLAPAKEGALGMTGNGAHLFNRWDALSIATLAALWCDLYLSSWSWLPASVADVVNQLWSRRQLACMNFGWPTFPLLVGVLLVSLSRSSTLGRWFDNRLLRVTATLSFGIYLWHSPILKVLHQQWPTSHLTSPVGQTLYGLTGLSLAYAAAWLSYRLVEKPALDFTRRMGF
ncbi:MAG: acyltransferase [Planctomycetales bacterium]|nr:acyltransferase [Planctomycetales bacterium]